MQQAVMKQKQFFASNKTKDILFRKEQLRKFKQVILDNEQLLFDAIYKDFKKSEFETYMAELSLLYHEINLAIKKLKRWTAPRKVSAGFANFPARSYILSEPLGTVLVIGAWNYPIQLALLPVVAAIAAGNTVIVKPSEISTETSAVIAQMINNNFDAGFLHVIEGGVAKTTELLNQTFDKIFFTGSTNVGKLIYQAAAKNMCPVTLELGGKSPVFVLSDCNIKMTVKRLIWAKFLNAGQTCVAPDYVLVEKKIETEFLQELKSQIESYIPDNENINENYVQIINDKNFERLCSLIDNNKLFYGGSTDKNNRYISPTILNNISFDDEVMKDEIFGPILPVISFTDLDRTIQKVKEYPKPLSCYIYSKNRRLINKLLSEISFGGGAVNDSLMHLSVSHLPFGGIGLSGIGSYHGKAGFDNLTHYKSILDKTFWFESSIKYYPYTKNKYKILKWIFNRR